MKTVYHHKELAAGRWRELSLCEQMGHAGSEVSRALRWREKGNEEYCRRAAYRALELLSLTLDAQKGFARRREIARAKELLADFFFGGNQYHSTVESWRRYFDTFALMASRRR